MASLIYDSAIYDALTGGIDFRADAFRLMLVGPGYVPDKAGHARRSDVTGEIAGRGYEAGGADVAVTAQRFADGTIEVSLGGAIWSRANLRAAGGVYYKARGGPADLDELVAFIDFGDIVVSSNGDWQADRSTLQFAAAA